jgi:hypothetical protein
MWSRIVDWLSRAWDSVLSEARYRFDAGDVTAGFVYVVLSTIHICCMVYTLRWLGLL